MTAPRNACAPAQMSRSVLFFEELSLFNAPRFSLGQSLGDGSYRNAVIRLSAPPRCSRGGCARAIQFVSQGALVSARASMLRFRIRAARAGYYPPSLGAWDFNQPGAPGKWRAFEEQRSPPFPRLVEVRSFPCSRTSRCQTGRQCDPMSRQRDGDRDCEDRV